MKRFFTVIPLQVQGQLRRYHYTAVGNQRLQMETETSFPIITAMEGYTEPGEEIAVIAVVTDSEAGQKNLEAFQQEVDDLCRRKGVTCQGIQEIHITTDEQVSAQVATFQKLINYVADDDELFSCMTYGTKPLSTAVMMAVQYAYRIKKNTSISCIVYGQIDRPGKDPETWSAKVYDMTALVQLDEIVRVLADRGVANPKETIDSILSL